MFLIINESQLNDRNQQECYADVQLQTRDLRADFVKKAKRSDVFSPPHGSMALLANYNKTYGVNT